MAPLTREEIFAQAAKKLRAEFEELSVVPHNAVKGHEAENLVRRFLNDHIPKRFAVGSGFILDLKGQVSPQTDVIVYDAFNCPIYRASDDAAIFPSNNVAVVVEVKSNLTKETLTDAWSKIETIKSLAKHKPGPGPLKAQTVGFLFAFNSSLKLTTIAEHYGTLFRERGLGRHIDVIVVLDRGIITLAAKPRGTEGWAMAFLEGFGGPEAEGSHLAISTSQLGESTLDGFFRLLLPHLTLFRPIVDQPSFNFSDMPIPVKNLALVYLMSLTTEQNPKKREEKLRAYRDEVIAEFDKAPMPRDWE